MTLEVLMSCMNQQDTNLAHKSCLVGNVVMINQCDHVDYIETATQNGIVRMYSVKERGLTKSRNMAIEKARADVCLLCDDDEIFVPDYETAILDAYEDNPQADVIIFKMVNRPPSFADRTMRLRFPNTMKISSWQISFRRKRILDAGIRFDELLGAGTGNGAEEELKFLLDCERAGLTIYYVPVEIAAVAQEASTWFAGFNETFFENRGATTRYILGPMLASLYAVYYVIRKRDLYRESITPMYALTSTFRGIRNNKIGKQADREMQTKQLQ